MKNFSMISPLFVLGMWGCSSEPIAPEKPPSVVQARADLESKSGSFAQGRVEFTEAFQGLDVKYKFTGLKKNGIHA